MPRRKSNEAKTDEVQIESGIPIPKIKRKSKYPFAKMKVGQCFIKDENIQTLRSSAYAAAKKNGHKYTVRPYGEKVGVWRVG